MLWNAGVPTTENALLKESLIRFFQGKPERFMAFYDVVNKKTDYSLRVLEWFVTKHAGNHDVVIPLEKGKECNVALDYHNQMTSYQKKCFDPFRRHHKFVIADPKSGLSFVTTVCQMNFFKWAIENKVLDYVKQNLDAIKEDMAKASGIPEAEQQQQPRPPTMHTKISWGTKSRKGTGGMGTGMGIGSGSKKASRASASVCASRTCVKRYKNIILTFD